MNGPHGLRNSGLPSGKQSLLPPKCPFPIGSSYGDHGSSHQMGSKGIPRPRPGQSHHQRTSSESFLVEEQPSWLDDLLNEPETPVKRGAHRRSSSDSFAYLDASNVYCNVDNLAHNGFKQGPIMSHPSWGSEDFDYYKDAQSPSYFPEAGLYGRPQSRGREPALSAATYLSSIPSPKDRVMHQGSASVVMNFDALTSNTTEKRDQEESSQGAKGTVERRENSQAKQPQPEVEQKRVKQQFAQRSRVRKLQYIAELERNVQALQAEGSEMSAELEFLDQQNLILNLENKTLKQRLESLQQQHLLKCFQQEMLDREIARLRALYHHQQQQLQHPPPTHGRSKSRDLDAQFANLSLKHNEANSGREPVREPVTGPLQI